MKHEDIVKKAREIGSKYGKQAELDFGAGAEWACEQNQSLTKEVERLKKVEGIKYSQIIELEQENNRLRGQVEKINIKAITEVITSYLVRTQKERMIKSKVRGMGLNTKVSENLAETIVKSIKGE